MRSRGFHNRREAGEALAERLIHHKDDPDAIVLGLPRGGVILASAISKTLSLSLEVFLARKLRSLCNMECALGAITETGVTYIDEGVLCMQNCLQNELRVYLEHEIDVQKAEIVRQKHLFRNDGPLPELKGRSIILVDDGIATGATFFASVDALREKEVRSIVGAVPVGPETIIRQMHYKVDELLVLIRPANFRAVSQYYSDFRETTDDEVVRLLKSRRTANSLPHSA